MSCLPMDVGQVIIAESRRVLMPQCLTSGDATVRLCTQNCAMLSKYYSREDELV